MSEQHHYHNDEDDSIEEQNGKDGAQEGTKEYASVTNEAAGGRRIINYIWKELSLEMCTNLSELHIYLYTAIDTLLIRSTSY